MAIALSTARTCAESALDDSQPSNQGLQVQMTQSAGSPGTTKAEDDLEQDHLKQDISPTYICLETFLEDHLILIILTPGFLLNQN